ncbi:MAG: hypothetical protein M5U01_10000 [Ardenticatenaceae bacterium]|nr:hypothetical protein [Ardenticatenaceae bacterium]
MHGYNVTRWRATSDAGAVEAVAEAETPRQAIREAGPVVPGALYSVERAGTTTRYRADTLGRLRELACYAVR